MQAEAETAPVSANVFKTDQIPAIETGGLSVLAASTDLVTTLRGQPSPQASS